MISGCSFTTNILHILAVTSLLSQCCFYATVISSLVASHSAENGFNPNNIKDILRMNDFSHLVRIDAKCHARTGISLCPHKGDFL